MACQDSPWETTQKEDGAVGEATFALMGVVHLLALPGGGGDSPGLSAVLDRALRDAEALVQGGIGVAVLENFGDAPFPAGASEPHVSAMMAVIAARLQQEWGGALRLGINVLRNDVRAALGIAAACGAPFVRVNVHAGAAWTDQGLIQGQAHDTLRYRRELGAEGVKIAADILVKHAVPAGTTDVREAAQETAYRGRADVLIVTGAHTGGAADLRQVEQARLAVPDRPVWVGSGVTAETLPVVQGVAQGAIVGTWLHQQGQLQAPLDVERVRRLVGALR